MFFSYFSLMAMLHWNEKQVGNFLIENFFRISSSLTCLCQKSKLPRIQSHYLSPPLSPFPTLLFGLPHFPVCAYACVHACVGTCVWQDLKSRSPFQVLKYMMTSYLDEPFIRRGVGIYYITIISWRKLWK